VNSVPDVVHAGRTGLIAPPRAPAALATAIGYLLAHPEHAAAMAAAARAEVDRGFEPAALGRDLMETYDRAIAEHRSVPSERLRVVA
jgi:glycosyltransferase involved in cell wall biosynthesis